MFKKTPKQLKLEKRVLDLESQVEALNRIIAVKDAELQSMSAVIARDRERVKSEASGFARARAENEGSNAK